MMRRIPSVKSNPKFKDPEPAEPKMFVQRYREPRGYPGPQKSFEDYQLAMRYEEEEKSIKIKNEPNDDDGSALLPIRTKGGGGIMRAGVSRRKQVETSDPAFYPFTRLPQELRDMIWKLAIPVVPRVVKVKTLWLPKPRAQHNFNLRSRKADKDGIDIEDYEYANSKAITDVPVLLQVCKESRKAALTVYTLSFERQLAKKPIYMNFSIDSLYFHNWQMFFDFAAGSNSTAYRKDVVAKLKHLIIGGHLCYPSPSTSYTYKQLGWEELETLTLMDAWCSEHEVAHLNEFWVKVKGTEVLPEVNLVSLEELIAIADV